MNPEKAEEVLIDLAVVLSQEKWTTQPMVNAVYKAQHLITKYVRKKELKEWSRG